MLDYLKDVDSNRLTLLPLDLTTERSSATVNALSWHSNSHTDFFTAVVLHPKKRLSNLDMDHLHVTSDINVISPPLFIISLDYDETGVRLCSSKEECETRRQPLIRPSRHLI